MDDILKLFVYGTLKRGYWNHERFCRGVLSVEKATVRGRLYKLTSGIPVIEVPETDILAHGTSDPLADIATQARFSERLSLSRLGQKPKNTTQNDWGPVLGELLTFDDPSTRLPSIDGLEGFRPGSRSMYRRVLIPVWGQVSVCPAWVYSMDAGSHAQRLADGVWHW